MPTNLKRKFTNPKKIEFNSNNNLPPQTKRMNKSLHPWKFKMEQKIPKKNFQGLFVSEHVNFDFDMSSNIPDLLLLHK